MSSTENEEQIVQKIGNQENEGEEDQEGGDGDGSEENRPLTLSITPLIGTPIPLTILLSPSSKISTLKKYICKKLKLFTEINLLDFNNQLLDDNNTIEGSGLSDHNSIKLVPQIGTGGVNSSCCGNSSSFYHSNSLFSKRPRGNEQSVLDALEALDQSQVVDFLHGKSPLNLTMRLGDHIVLIQLQLSRVSTKTVQSPSTSTSAGPSGAPSTSEDQSESGEAIPQDRKVLCEESLKSSPTALRNATKELTDNLKKLSRESSSSNSSGVAAPSTSSPSSSTSSSSDSVYSAVFSGTLSGSREPETGIALIVNILNDLIKSMETDYKGIACDENSVFKKVGRKRNRVEGNGNSASSYKKSRDAEQIDNENQSLRIKIEKLKEQLLIEKSNRKF